MGALVEQRSLPGIQMPQPDSMLTVIERAVMAPDFDVNKLAELLALRQQYEAIEARKAFVVAMNQFKRNPPAIIKNKHVRYQRKDGGWTEYDHATLAGVCDAVIEGLATNGIAHAWKVDQTPDWVKVTCTLTHSDGHTEQVTMGGAPDASGGKNAIQAVGSAVTYLERYTLMAAVGLAADEDNDGRGANSQPQGQQTQAGGTLGDEQYVGLLDGVKNASTVDELKTLYLAAVAEAEKVGDMKAKNEFIKAKNIRYKEVRDAH